MKKCIATIGILMCLATTAWAGSESENALKVEVAQKDVQIYQLQLQNLQLIAQSVNREYPALSSKLQEAQEKLRLAEEQAKKEKKVEDKK